MPPSKPGAEHEQAGGFGDGRYRKTRQFCGGGSHIQTAMAHLVDF